MKKTTVLATTLFVTGLSIGSAVIESAYAFGSHVFSVTRVAKWDKLNVRDKPGVSNEVIGKIPANGKGIVLVGDKKEIGNTTWLHVAWGPVRGWVSQRYLEIADLDIKTEINDEQDLPQFRTRTNHPRVIEKAVNLECGGIKPFWNIDLSETEMQVNIKDEHYSLPVAYQRKSSLYDKSILIKGKEGSDTAKLYISKDYSCKDGITDINYPYTVKAIINGKQSYSGCCNIASQ